MDGPALREMLGYVREHWLVDPARMGRIVRKALDFDRLRARLADLDTHLSSSLDDAGGIA